MKKVFALGLSLGLVACNCGDSSDAGTATSKGIASSLPTLLATLPAEGTVLALAAHDTTGLLAGIDALATRLLGPLTDVNAGRNQVKEQLGFDPLTEAGWATAGVDVKKGVGVWYGGTGERADWQVLVTLTVADKAKFTETAKRLAQREGAMGLGTPVAHDGGEWTPFERTFGLKTVVSGGMLITGNSAVVSGGDLASLAGLAQGKPRLDSDATLKALLKKLPGSGQAVFYGSDKVSQLDQSMQVDPTLQGLAAKGWLSSLSATAKRVDAQSVALYDEEGAKKVAAMTPKPLPVPPIPTGTAVAWTQSFSAKSMLDLLRTIPQFGQAWGQIEQGLKPLGLDAEKDILAHLGTTFSAWIGVGKEPTSLLTLMASAFVGLDVAGGKPQGLVNTMKTLVEKAGAPVPGLTMQDNGFDFSHEMGKLTLRADGKNLSLRFGQAPEGTLESGRPAAKVLKLGGNTSTAFWLDFQTLASSLKAGAGMLAASPAGPIAVKAAEVLAQIDYAAATGGMEGVTQLGSMSLVLKDAPAAK